MCLLKHLGSAAGGCLAVGGAVVGGARTLTKDTYSPGYLVSKDSVLHS